MAFAIRIFQDGEEVYELTMSEDTLQWIGSYVHEFGEQDEYVLVVESFDGIPEFHANQAR